MMIDVCWISATRHDLTWGEKAEEERTVETIVIRPVVGKPFAEVLGQIRSKVSRQWIEGQGVKTF